MKTLNEKQRMLVKTAVDSLANVPIEGPIYDKVYGHVANYFSVPPDKRTGQFAKTHLSRSIKGTGCKTVGDVVDLLDARNFQLHGNAGRKPKSEEDKAKTVSVVVSSKARHYIESLAASTGQTEGSVIAQICRDAAETNNDWSFDDLAVASKRLSIVSMAITEARKLMLRSPSPGRVGSVRNMLDSVSGGDATEINQCRAVLGDLIDRAIRMSEARFRAWIDKPNT